MSHCRLSIGSLSLNSANSQEKQEKFVGDVVWLKGTPQGTIKLHVVNQRLKEKKWYLQLKSPREEFLYNDGAWYPQKKVSMAQKGPKHNV